MYGVPDTMSQLYQVLLYSAACESLIINLVVTAVWQGRSCWVPGKSTFAG